MSGRPLRPFEALVDVDRWTDQTPARADEVIEEGWRFADFPPLELTPPVDWAGACGEHRSRSFHLHAWTPLGPVLAALDRSADGTGSDGATPGSALDLSPDVALDFALALATDWLRSHPGIGVGSPFAWYDMAVGLRAYRLAFLADVASRASGVPAGAVDVLVEGVRLHARALEGDGLFSDRSNHGVYVAAGEAALAARFPDLAETEGALERARERLRGILGSQFTSEGVHREHSPGYHLMVLETLESLRRTGLLDGEETAALSDRVQEALAWFVLPDGRLAMFGDTTDRRVTDLPSSAFGNAALRWVVSRGKEGAPPPDTARGFPLSGYVAVREGWSAADPRGTDGSYLAQAAAFHSRTHKHADDLTFVWFDRGHEILTDSGGYDYAGRTEPGSDLWRDGFWYADPRRIYTESTRAHNTVEIDGRNLPRRNVEPYGSAIMRWGERAGVRFIESGLRHWDTIAHRRVLLLRPGAWLVVFDWLCDEETQPHRFVQRFHFAPELEVGVRAEPSADLEVRVPRVAEPLHVTPLLDADLVAPVRGRTEPELHGWIARERGELTPRWTAGYAAGGRSARAMATLFAFGGGPASAEPPLDPFPPETTGPDPNGRFRLRWSQDGRTHSLAFSRDTQGPFRLEYRLAVDHARTTGGHDSASALGEDADR